MAVISNSASSPRRPEYGTTDAELRFTVLPELMPTIDDYSLNTVNVPLLASCSLGKELFIHIYAM